MPLSVCFVLPSAYGYFSAGVETVSGGRERQFSFISKALAKDFDVHFVVGDYGQAQSEVKENVTLHRSYHPSSSSSPSSQIYKLLRLANAMRRADADVYIYRGHARHAAITYAITKLLGAKWVYNIGNDPNIDAQPQALPAPLRWLFYYGLRDADAVIAQTEYQAERLSSEHDVDATIIPSGYPTAEETLQHSSREFFLWVGRLDPEQKRPHVFLDLAEHVPDTKFVLIGPKSNDESYSQQIKERATELNNVSFEGRVDPADVYDYYKRAIALINTSAYEGFPSTFLEAWRYRTPVLSYEVDPARFIDAKSVPGFANGDVDRLIEDVRRLASDMGARRQFSEPTHEYFRKNLTLDQIADSYRDVFCSLSSD